MGRRRTIGILMDFHIPGVIEGVGAYCAKYDLRADSRWSVRADWTPALPGWDAVISHVIDMKETFQRIEGLGLPMVHLNETLGGNGWPRLSCDYRACAKMAVEEFQSLGVKRVAVTEWKHFPVDRMAREGVVEAAKEFGLEMILLKGWPRSVAWTDGLTEIAKELSKMKHPCGLFLPHAGVAFSLLDALSDIGLRVPEDLPIIVIDKDVQRTAELAPIPLTSVILDEWQQGYEAAELAHRLLEGERMNGFRKEIAPVGLARRNSTGVGVSKDPAVAKAMHLIRNHLNQINGVSQLAGRVGVSRRALEMRFRRETGSTVHAMLTSQRMQSAKRLLRTTGQTVAEVAEVLGFSSVHYFTTAFKREVGVNPGAYRSR